MNRSSLARPAAIAMSVAIVLSCAVDLVFAFTLSPKVPAFDATLAGSLGPVVPTFAIAVIAILLAWQRPANPAGWLLGGFVLGLVPASIGQEYLFDWLYARSVPAALVVPMGLLNVATSSPAFLSLTALLFVFPDGHLLSARWRPAIWAIIAVAVASGVIPVLDPGALGDGHRQVANPLGIPGAHEVVGVVNGVVGTFLVFGLFGLGIVAMVLRYRRSGSEVRQQVKWVGVGAVVMVGGIIFGILTSTTTTWTTPAPIAGEIIGFSALPISIAVAIFKYRLYEIDVVINRAIVYGSLAAFITLVYVAIVVGAGALLGRGGRPNLALSIVATAVVAVGFQPVRERLQRLANRLVYGRRATPYEVLSEFSGRVAETYAGDDVLPRMARVLAEGTGALSATVWLRAGQELRPAAVFPAGADGNVPVAVTGQLLPTLTPDGQAVAVRHQGELLGALAVCKRAGESLTPIEQKLLGDLANQAGLVLKNVGLTSDLEAHLADLQASRQRLVRAQDDERRRLERSLHEGAQKSLIELKDRLAAARSLATSAPAEARELLGELKNQTDATLQDLRDIARGIYPPLLAEKGLAEALEAQARKTAIPVSVMAEGIGRHPREIEATVYFCCVEALRNVQLHSGASRATLRVRETGGELAFEVEDDGSGFDPATVRPGPGLGNMADRLDALGGRLSITASVGGGSVVGGMVPVAVAAAAAG